MLARDTLQEARHLRERPGAIGLVLGLDDLRFYVFHSRQTQDQVANSNTTLKTRLNRELAGRFAGFRGQPFMQTLAPVDTPALWQDNFRALLPFSRAAAQATQMDPEGRHAEEEMIENWQVCVADFFARHQRAPQGATVYLSHCPCQPDNTSPSPVRRLGGKMYSATCAMKLKQFCTTGDRAQMPWTVYYQNPFGDLNIDLTQGRLRIMRGNYP